MFSNSRPLRTLAVGFTAAVTIGAGLTAFVASPAQADVASRITISPSAQTGAAGTCLAYTVTVLDAFGRPATDTGTVGVEITENPNSETQDVDFCIPAGGEGFSTYSEFPNYINAGVVSPDACPPSSSGETGCQQFYAPGPSITTAASDSPSAPPSGKTDNPDAPADTAPATSGGVPPGAGNVNNNANPSGTDRAEFQYNTGSNTGSGITFGVVGLTPGGADIVATVKENKDIAPTQAKATFRTGGRPGTAVVANAARSITVEPQNSVQPVASATHVFSLTVRNAEGDTLFGVTPSYIVESGPGRNTTPRDCTPTNNSGESTCTYTATAAGVDSLLFFINQTTGTPTAGVDSGEPRATATATTTPPPVAAEFAFMIDLQPDQATTAGGTSRTFTAVVTSTTGAPAQGVAVNFVESGPGVFRGAAENNGSSVVTATTDATGRASVVVDVPSGTTGQQTITATINNPSTTQCQTTGGRCTDTTINTVTAGASPAATATASATPSATASAGASASPTTSPSGPPAPACTTPASVSLDRDTIIATGSAQITVRGTVNSVVDVFAYSRPSTTYRMVRSIEVGGDGVGTDRIVPPTNTRLYAQQRGCNASPSIVLNVRTQISLNVVRNGVRNYTFSGRLLPARPNGLIASLYRVTNDGRQILTAQTRANAAPGQAGYDASRAAGSYTIVRQFTGTGRFGFVVRTGQDLQNAPGSSNVRSLLVY